MKKLVILFASMFIFAVAVQNVNAQTEVSADASTTATIITPLAIVKTVDLDFGNIVAGPTAGTVTVAPDGSRSKTGGVTLPAATPGAFKAAEFDVTGLALATYSIAITNATFNVTGPGEPMQVNTIVTSPTPTGTLNASGAQTITVGATLEVGINQAAGVYTNATDLKITVAYN